MALWTRKNPALASMAVWAVEVSTDSELSEQRPFSSITVQNYSPHNCEFYINGRLYGNVAAYSYQKFSGLAEVNIDTFSVKNGGIASIPADKLYVTLANSGTDVSISGMGGVISSEIDKTVLVTEDAEPLMAADDVQRFPAFAEVSVSSMGDLIPGTHKIYVGAGLAKQLLNVGSYYNYEQIQGQRYDLNKIYVMCDTPFSELLTNGDFESDYTAWTQINPGTGSGTFAIESAAPLAGTKSAHMTLTGYTGGTAMELYTHIDNVPAVIPGRTYRNTALLKGTGAIDIGSVFRDASKNIIGSPLYESKTLTSTPTLYTQDRIAPSNAAYMRVYVRFISGNADVWAECSLKTLLLDTEKPQAIISGGV